MSFSQAEVEQVTALVGAWVRDRTADDFETVVLALEDFGWCHIVYVGGQFQAFGMVTRDGDGKRFVQMTLDLLYAVLIDGLPPNLHVTYHFDSRSGQLQPVTLHTDGSYDRLDHLAIGERRDYSFDFLTTEATDADNQQTVTLFFRRWLIAAPAPELISVRIAGRFLTLLSHAST
jgi:hypothetical protein